MSQKYDDNCLPRLRAYYRALAKADPVTSRDVKVMLLGNGRVGKTKLRKRLEKDVWDPVKESTHGIHIGAAVLPAAGTGTPPETPLRIWDFGGQDIYLGTHALFLRSRAIFPVMWMPESEPSANPSHRWNGIEHENFPLGYWVRYVAQMAGTKSPLLLIQSQCESEAQKAWKSPVDEALWQPFAFKRPYIPYAARNDAGRQELTSGLQAAVAALDAQRQGDALPASWLKVKAHIETLQATDQAIWDPKDRTHRTLTRQGFADICRSVAGIEDEASADGLLRVLHDAGTVFWREGWFKDLIIVDQQWALSAIYAVLDRGTEEGRDGGVFQYLRDERRGRFTRMELDALLWGKAGHSPEQQQVFIEMMRACGICFELRKAHKVGDVSVPAVYLAPDLLPAKAERAHVLADRWEPGLATLRVVFQFTFVPPGLLRSLMAAVGDMAGDAGEYWREGFFLFDGETGARLMVEETRNADWSGAITIATQKGDARELAARIAAMLEEQAHRLGISDRVLELPDGLDEAELAERRQRSHHGYRLHGDRRPSAPPRPVELQPEADAPAPAALAVPAVSAAIEPGSDLDCYISYKHGDGTDAGRLRQEAFDAVKSRIAALGLTPRWDASDLRRNDSIEDYKKRIARGDKVVIILSDGYLRGRYCVDDMVALHDHCLKEPHVWRQRVRVFRVAGTPLQVADWGAYALHWKAEAEKLDAQITALEPVTQALSLREEKEKYVTFARQIMPVLETIADTLHVRDVARIDELSFD